MSIPLSSYVRSKVHDQYVPKGEKEGNLGQIKEGKLTRGSFWP